MPDVTFAGPEALVLEELTASALVTLEASITLEGSVC